jgi:ferredoxin
MAITIHVDDNACVGCSLCADVCPTKVFEFNESKALPEVKKPRECFGCLSCSEICPASALVHTDAVLSQSYYHDPLALKLSAKLGLTLHGINAPTENEQALKEALGDLEIRLLSVAAVLKQTLGQSLPAIGTQAGKSLASQLPRYQQPKSIEEALLIAHETLAPAWNIGHEISENKLTLRIKDCFVREVCVKSSMELGGDLCVLFYGYFAGYFSKLAKVRPRLITTTRDQKECVYDIQLHAAST